MGAGTSDSTKSTFFIKKSALSWSSQMRQNWPCYVNTFFKNFVECKHIMLDDEQLALERLALCNRETAAT